MEPNNPLSIESLESDLRHAQGALEKATTARVHAQEIESQWITEVNSLNSLIEVRKKRLGQTTGNSASVRVPISGVAARAALGQPTITTVDWIEKLVANSGPKGVTPPEILRAAADVKLHMHKNYPYIVLAKLVERGKVDKREGRYYPVAAA